MTLLDLYTTYSTVGFAIMMNYSLRCEICYSYCANVFAISMNYIYWAVKMTVWMNYLLCRGVYYPFIEL